jgi:putative transposase
MSSFRRHYKPGGTFFFTVVTHQRQPIFANEHSIVLLRDAFRREQQRRPFAIEAAIVLPDHLHFLLRLPVGDTDYPGRWRDIKKRVSRQLPLRGQKIWQRRYWEHTIRDERDWCNHLDYIHYNPVKHGYAGSPADWRWSSFLRWVERGVYDRNWGAGDMEHISGFDWD